MTALTESFEDPEQAFARGIFKRIDTATIDLPSPTHPPGPLHANHWLSRMPLQVATLLTDDLQSSFFAPLHHHIARARATNDPLPRPKVHASAHQYAMLLDRADAAGMLYWSLLPLEHPSVSPLADAIEMTLFAMSKDEHRNRLISWPRLPNLVIPDPPHTSLPDPSLFDCITTQGSTISAFYLDIHNMFHNIVLPTALAHLFPMKPIRLDQLHLTTRLSLHRRLPLQQYPNNILLRPFQATMPMGFKWSVFIAHTFADSCLKQAFSIFRSSTLAPSGLTLLKLQREYAPFSVSTRSPLLLHVIDDIAAIMIDWPDAAVQCWHRITRQILRFNKLPVAEAKSCPVYHVEKQQVPFIGCVWDLTTQAISPNPKKLNIILKQLHALISAATIDMPTWKRLVGRLVWISLLNRPLLSCTNAVFVSDHDADPAAAYSLTPPRKREVFILTSLFPLAQAITNLPLFPILVAFDASLQAGAVTSVRVTLPQAQAIWFAAKQQQYYDSDTIPAITSAGPFISTLPWRKVISHTWRKPNQHINALEASAAVLALEWATRTGAQATRLIILTDSAVVLGALRKGRSSAIPLSLRCRRIAALTLAHNLRVTFAYIPTNLNPADRYTRPQ